MKKEKNASNRSRAKMGRGSLFIAGFPLFLGVCFLFFACKNPLVKPFYDRFGNENNPNQPVLAGTVIIRGLPLAGSVLTADTSGLNAPGPFNYQWKRNGVDIPGATGNVYTIDTADLEQPVTVAVSCAGYKGSVLSAPYNVTGALILLSKDSGPDASFADLETALGTITASGSYMVKIGADQNLAPYTLPAGASITLIAQNTPVTVQLSENDYLFTIGSGRTLTLDNGIIIKGRNLAEHGADNIFPLIRISSEGALNMKSGSAITGNTSGNSGAAVNISGTNSNFTMEGGDIYGNNTDLSGGGVYIGASGTFTMKGGTISGNSAYTNGGAVCVNSTGAFIMQDGLISGNSADQGGGAYVTETGSSFTMNGGTILSNTATMGGGVGVSTNGTFNMYDGTILSNTATMGGGVGVSTNGTFNMYGGGIPANTATIGGGVYAGNYGAFTMEGGTIPANTATNGGGVYVDDSGIFFMSDGFISANNAYDYGGGVYISNSGNFSKSAGTIYGINDSPNSNYADSDSNGTGSGHAAYYDGIPPQTRANTAGPGDSMVSGTTIGWD